MNIQFLKPAQEELDEAISYYNYQRQGLGNEFLVEVLKTIDLIQQHPLAWRQVSTRLRRCLMKRFPYSVIYSCQGDKLLLVAIAHLHRKPNYWLGRVH
jgi:hypothetical protein